MMRVLLIDHGANFLDFALRCTKCMHHVKWFIGPDKNNERIPVGDGMGVERINDWQKWMKWADIVVLSDNVKYIAALEPYRKLGYPIFGANLTAQKMELDREFGQKVMKDAGVEIMPYKTFHDYDTAIAYVNKTMKRFVSKPSGDADKALSYCSKDAKGMIGQLQRWKKMGKLKQPFILQEFVPGVEMAVGGWFGRNGWNAAINENWEHKKLMAGDLSVNTGETGTVMRYVKKSKLADKLLFPLSDYLMSIGYTGYIDAAAIIAEDGEPKFLEHTARFGWPHSQIVTALHVGDPVEWMVDLLRGYDSLEVTDQVATGVVLWHGDFPFNARPRADSSGFPVYYDLENPNVHPCEMKMGIAPHEIGGKIVDAPTHVTAGPYILVASGTGPSVSSSARNAYKLLKEIETPNSPGYRNDIGERLKDEIPELQKHGYARDLKY